VDDSHHVEHSVAPHHLHQGAQAWFGTMVTPTKNPRRSLSPEDRKRVTESVNKGLAVGEPGHANAAIYTIL
jgi:hypothetical protein